MQTSTESFLPQEGTHCYVLYIRPSCDPVFSAQPTPSFCSISESSYSIHNWYTERVLNNKTSINPLLISTAEQHSPCWDTPHSTAFSHIWPQDIKWKKFPANFCTSVGLHQVLKWVQLTALILQHICKKEKSIFQKHWSPHQRVLKILLEIASSLCFNLFIEVTHLTGAGMLNK